MLPAQLYANLLLIEALVYGREWQPGYDKLPLLPWWMIEACYRLLGADLFYYALSQVTVIDSRWSGCWHDHSSDRSSASRYSVIDGPHYFNFTAPKFNHDVIQPPFWALAADTLTGQRRAAAASCTGSARFRDRDGLVGQIFRGDARGAARTVYVARPRRSESLATPAPISRLGWRSW